MVARIAKSFFLLVVSFFIACGGGGGGGDGSSESTSLACNTIGLPTRIINGQSCGDVARASVVRVMAVVDLGNAVDLVPICTGSLLTPSIVLTAAHCFIPEFGGLPVIGLGVYVGDPGQGRFISGVNYTRPSSYQFNPAVGRSFDDAALIALEESVGNPVLPVLTTRIPQVGEAGFVYGYGAREEIGEGGDDFFTLEAGAMTLQNVTQNHVFVSFDGGGVNVCKGDSGGPLVVLVNGEPAIAGVVSQGSNATCEAGDVTTFTNIHSPGVFDWLVRSVPGLSGRSYEKSNFTDYETVLNHDGL